MKKIKIFIEAVVVIAVVMSLILPSSAVVTNNKAEKKNLDMQIMEINEPISIGGPFKIKDEKVPFSYKNTIVEGFKRGDDIQVTFDPDFQGNPALGVDSDGTMLLAYEYEEDVLERTIYMATSEDGGDLWEIQGVWDVPGTIDELSSMDYAGLINDMQAFHGIFLCSENDYGDVYHIEILDVNNPDIEFWNLWTTPFSDNGFFDFSACDVTTNDEMIGATTDYFVLSLVGSFEDIEGYPDCYQVPFYQVRVDETSWIFWFYYNYSANGRMDIDRTAEIIYYAFEWDNGADQDVILLSSELEFVGQVEPEGWGDGMGEGRKYAVEGSANTINPAIAAENNYVYLVLQTDVGGNQDIVCYYSSDAGDTYQMSVIADSGSDEANPSIYATGEKAYCVFTKDNDLYLAETEDGGQTWTISDETVNDEEGSVVEQYKTADIYGPSIVWTDEREDDGDVFFDTFIVKQAPGEPTIDGPSNGNSGEEITFTFSAVDPDGDDVRFNIDWGDGTTDETTFTGSGSDLSIKHTWTDNEDFTIKVRAEDINGAIGPEKTADISIPRFKACFENLFDVLPNLFRLLNLLFG